jgi:cytochrome c oxidase subunit 1
MPGDGSRANQPAPTYWPLVLAFGLPIIGYGLIFNMILCGVGGAIVLAGFVGWGLEPTDDEDLPPNGHDGHDGDDPSADAPKEEVTVDG